VLSTRSPGLGDLEKASVPEFVAPSLLVNGGDKLKQIVSRLSLSSILSSLRVFRLTKLRFPRQPLFLITKVNLSGKCLATC